MSNVDLVAERQRDISLKLADISLCLANADTFINVRFMLEDMVVRGLSGDADASEIVAIVHRFDRLCKVANGQ